MSCRAVLSCTETTRPFLQPGQEDKGNDGGKGAGPEHLVVATHGPALAAAARVVIAVHGEAGGGAVGTAGCGAPTRARSAGSAPVAADDVADAAAAGAAGHRVGSGGGAAGRGGAGALVHVGAGALEACQDGGLVAVDDGVVCAGGVVVVVALALVGARGGGGIVALDRDLAEGGKVVAVVADVVRVPVDGAAGPLNGVLGVGGVTTGPDGELDTGRGLGEVVLVGGGVPGVGLLEGAADVAVDEPDDLVRGPLDLVVVEVLVRVGELCDVLGVCPCGEVFCQYSPRRPACMPAAAKCDELYSQTGFAW